ncbi:MAG: LysR family transcriptional regulator [Xanthomonadales bacterium]|jgi:DNA-binding transcriptional LysR family regulator|nr:LysR family transcriptional regulator [Xanthomonadales bacterium]
MTQSTPRFYYKGSRLKQLRAFCHAARLGSVTRASEALFLSQPAVSLQLGALESELNVRLFERHGRRLNLTAEGQLLYDMARPLVDGLDALDGDFRSRVKGLEGGELNIAAGSSTILYLLPALVAEFRRKHPDIQLKLHSVSGNEGLQKVRADEVDLAVGSMLDSPSDIDYAPLYNFDQLLVMPLDHPLARKSTVNLEDLSPYGLILPPGRVTTYRLIDRVFQQRKVPYNVALEVDGWEVIKQYVIMGLGISIITSLCISHSDRERLAIHNLREHFPQRSYGVVVRKGKRLSPAARAFIDQIKPSVFARSGQDDNDYVER